MKKFIVDFYQTYIKRFLTFVRILDEQGNLSITNLLVMIFVWKFAQTSMDTFSIESVGPMIAAMGMYFGKKVVNKPKTDPVITPEVTDEIVNKLKEFTNMDQEEG